MTPLEAIASAAYSNWIEPVQCCEPAWHKLPEDHRLRLIEAMRAALLSLNECELSDPLLDEVWLSLDGQIIDNRDLQKAFHAICRAFVEQSE